MGFELFDSKRKPLGSPTISLAKHGAVNINTAAYEKYFKGYKWVLLYYDRERRVIGLKPTNDYRKEAYELHPRSEGKTANLSGVAFFKHIGLKLAESKTISAVWNDTDKLVELDLNA